MYQLSIPVMLSDHFRKEATLEALQKVHANRVFLAVDSISFDPQQRQHVLGLLAETIPYFQENGLETGVWFWSFLRDNLRADTRNCERRVDHTGVVHPSTFCPASPGFIEDTADFLTEVARLHPDLMMFDDDFAAASTGASPARCYCPRHLKRMQEILGEEISREALYEKAFHGKPNRYRQAVLQASGESLEHFAAEIRRAVDAVNPKIRIALCSVICSWDMDGTNAIRLARILAGGTRPLLRLINGTYWSTWKAWGNRLQHTIELGRMEYEWCKGMDLEVMSEGDVYPRPRYQVPASFLEGYDTAHRAAGVTDGILKYMLDYNSSPGYETGYLDRHVNHEPLYRQISAAFDGKIAVGVRVYEAMEKYADADLTGIENPFQYGWDLFFSRAARLLTDNTIPTTYDGTGCCGIAFGENARHLPPDALNHGLILDLRAAEILMGQGVDVGIASIGEAVRPQLSPSGCSSPQYLYYPEENEYVPTGYGAHSARRLVPKPGARVITFVKDALGETPDTILYTNGSGQKFLVYGFDAAFTDEVRYRSYSMQRQLSRAIQWLSGSPLPAHCAGNPDLYIQCKKSEHAMSVGLWNFFPDEIDKPTVVLDHAYSHIEFLNCTGHQDGNVVTLSTLAPYGFAFFTVQESAADQSSVPSRN